MPHLHLRINPVLKRRFQAAAYLHNRKGELTELVLSATTTLAEELIADADQDDIDRLVRLGLLKNKEML